MKLEEILMEWRESTGSEAKEVDIPKENIHTTISGYDTSISDDTLYGKNQSWVDEVRKAERLKGTPPERRTDRRNRINLKRKWGLIRCGGPNRRVNPWCPALLIVKDGQRTKKCHRCGHVRSLGRKHVYCFSDEQSKIRREKREMEWKGTYRTRGDLDV